MQRPIDVRRENTHTSIVMRGGTKKLLIQGEEKKHVCILSVRRMRGRTYTQQLYAREGKHTRCSDFASGRHRNYSYKATVQKMHAHSCAYVKEHTHTAIGFAKNKHAVQILRGDDIQLLI